MAHMMQETQAELACQREEAHLLILEEGNKFSCPGSSRLERVEATEETDQLTKI